MDLADWTGVGIGLSGLVAWLFAARCYLELRRWARQCQGARIAIAHKRRVQLDAPLTDWLGWANTLDDDEGSRGRIIYRNGHVSVAILKPAPAPVVEVERPGLLRRLARRSSSSETAAA